MPDLVTAAPAAPFHRTRSPAVRGPIAVAPTDMAGDLQDEIKQPKPFRSPEAEVFLNLLRTSTVLVGMLTDLLREHELTQPQYNVLRILRGASREGLPSGEIGGRMVSREPDVTRLLDRMEARGLIERERGTADRRVVTVRLTPEGARLVDALDEPIQQLHGRQLGHLASDELRTLNTLLRRARDASS
jgi:DNA-binding MarR family transcriptional regulator